MASGSIATLLFRPDGIKIIELQRHARVMTCSVLLAVTLAYTSVFVRSQPAVLDHRQPLIASYVQAG